MRFAFAVLLLVQVTGCFVYVPLGADRPQVGRPVRATLTTEGSTELTPRLGPGVVSVRGVMVSEVADSFPIAVRSYLSLTQGEQQFSEAVVRLPRGHVAQLEEKRFSRTRTALFVGAFVAAAILYDRTLAGSGHSGPSERKPPGQVE